MRELERALAELGLAWADVWALSLDRRAGTLVVVAADGRKLSGRLDAPGPKRPPAAGRRKKGVAGGKFAGG